MTSTDIYYCVYRITNLVEKKHYYGYKSTKIHPSKVVGITYFSSSKGSSGKIFIDDQKKNPNNYRYKIVQIFHNAQKAIDREIKLHHKFDVKNHPSFYNKANQTTAKFDTTGISMSLEARKKMSIASKGVPKSQQHKEALSGRKHTQEEISKISKALRGLVKSEEHRAKLAKASYENSHGSKNNNFKHYYVTPLGTVESPSNLSPIISRTTLYKWCTKCDDKILKITYDRTKWLKENFIWEYLEGKTFREIGFSTL